MSALFQKLLQFARDLRKMAKRNNTDNKIMKIIIKTLQQNDHVWQIRTELGRGVEKKIEETIIPKDIFGNAIANYTTLINVLRLLSDVTSPLRKSVEESIKKMKEDKGKPKEPIKQVKLSQGQIKRQAESQKIALTRTRSQISFLGSATDTLRKNLSSETMLEKVALALALTEVISYEDIDNKINTSRNRQFEIDIPITKYPDLASMQTQHSGQFLSIIENMFSIGGSIARSTGLG